MVVLEVSGVVICVDVELSWERERGVWSVFVLVSLCVVNNHEVG
jgi:hypothetical protein